MSAEPAQRPDTPTTATGDAPADGVRAWWQRPVWWIVTAVVVAAAAVLVGWRVGRGDTGLTARGERNRAAFASTQLADFARSWLDDVRSCTRPAHPGVAARGAVEYVRCTATSSGTGPLTVGFRRYGSVGDRNKAIDVPTTTLHARVVSNTKFGRNETKIVWAVPNVPGARNPDVYLIYWDVPGTPVSAELDATRGPIAPDERTLSTYWWAHQPR